MTSSGLRPCFSVTACFDSTESDDIPVSNFPMNPTPASRCSAAAGYRGVRLTRELLMEHTWGTVWGRGVYGMPLAIAVACPECGAAGRFIPPFQFVATDAPDPRGLRRWNNVLV